MKFGCSGVHFPGQARGLGKVCRLVSLGIWRFPKKEHAVFKSRQLFLRSSSQNM